MLKPQSAPLSRSLLFISALLFTLRLAAQTPIPAPSGLIAFWPGDGNANDIYSTNNGALSGGSSVTNPGYIGQCFVFDGNTGYCAFPDSPALHPTNMTIETWIRSDNLNATANGGYPGQQYIIFHQNAQAYNFEGFDLAKDRRPPGVGTNDTWCFEMTDTLGDNVFVESVTHVQTNTWYHVAGVRGSNYIALYVNGVLEAQTSINFPTGFGNYPLYFADTGESYYDPKFCGALDEVGYYNRDLSSNEIHAIYAAGHGGKCKTPTAVAINLQNTNSTRQAALTIGGMPGQAFGIQTAPTADTPTNEWIGLTNQTISGTSNVWMDPSAATDGQKFYRVLSGTIPVP
jgi:Concanavalin A-like lectin/glucanases superfamily